MGRDRHTGRGSARGDQKKRDGGRFFIVPASVMLSPAYVALSANARAMLFELALQCKGDDNGRLLLSRAALDKRGWTSNDMLFKGKRELLEAGFIAETVKGMRPNKAAWYAITWRELDKLDGFDPGAAAAFERGAYRSGQPVPPLVPKKSKPAAAHENAVLRPYGGAESAPTAPYSGVERAPAAPPYGAIEATLDPPSAPLCGHPLDTPSAPPAPAPPTQPTDDLAIPTLGSLTDSQRKDLKATLANTATRAAPTGKRREVTP